VAQKIMKSLSGKYDRNNAHLTVYAGAGGDDAKDWAEMLVRMYSKYADKRDWAVTALDERSLFIRGEYAYGTLKREAGVHRLVRISPFSPKKLRHTSFALVEILPELPELDEKAVKIPEEDLKMEASRAGGPGGQNVNRRATAVRLVHLPTGLAAEAQTERSQIQNRELALKLLKAKLFDLMEKQQATEISQLRTKVQPEWGHQIRSYVLHPYKLVKDHRTKVESHQPDKVLDGELDKFVGAEIELK